MARAWNHRLFLPDPAATARCGTQLASILRPGDVVALHGDLGAGKTALARAIIGGLMGTDVTVPSPTFTLLQHYTAPNGTIWHFDLYRIRQAEEIFELGWEDALTDGIVLVEWAERAAGYIPAIALHCTLSGASETGRALTFTGHESWEERLRGIF
ncbi:MAG: tRNA (adenosine(37)-N6)-threonylcarbamoyltransferase complex ATPase subunit type 1 TsaE [Alphaproteobacteria bacterium]